MTSQERQLITKLRNLQHLEERVRDYTEGGRKSASHPDRQASARRCDELDKVIDDFVRSIQDREAAERAYGRMRSQVCDLLREPDNGGCVGKHQT